MKVLSLVSFLASLFALANNAFAFDLRTALKQPLAILEKTCEPSLQGNYPYLWIVKGSERTGAAAKAELLQLMSDDAHTMKTEIVDPLGYVRGLGYVARTVLANRSSLDLQASEEGGYSHCDEVIESVKFCTSGPKSESPACKTLCVAAFNCR